VLSLLSYPLPLAWLGVGGLLGLAAARWYLTGRPFARSRFTLPLGLYLAGGAAGLYIAPTPGTAQLRFFGLLAAVGTFFLLAHLATSAQAARRIAATALVAGLVAAPLLFAFVIPSLHLERLPGPLRDWVVAISPATEPLWELRDPSGLLWQQVLLHHAELGALAACGVGLALGPLLAGGTRKARLLAGLAVGYFGLFLVLSTNLSAQLSAVLMALLLGAACGRWLLAGACSVVGLTIGLTYGLAHLAVSGPAGNLARFLPGSDATPATLLFRLEAWRNVLSILGDFRFTGVGLGLRSVDLVLGSYFRWVPEGYGRTTHPHSIFLESYLEQGLLGLAGLLGLIVVGLVSGGLAVARARDPVARSAALSAAGVALALILTGITDRVAATNVGTVVLFGAFGLLAALRRQQSPHHGTPSPRPWMAAIRRPATLVRTTTFRAVAALALAAAAVACSSPAAPHLADQVVRAAFAEAYLNLGMVTLTKGTVGRAVPTEERRQALEASASLLDQARRLDPGNPGIYRNLARVALARSQPAEAQRALRLAEAAASPDDSWTLFQVGRVYREAGDVDGAIAAWLRVDPAMGAWSGVGPAAELARWGDNLVKERRWQAAIKVNRAAIQVAPMDPQPYGALAAAVSHEYGVDAALQTMRELAGLEPNVPWPRKEAARLRSKVAGSEEGRLRTKTRTE
jgi:tetratricopeptide (TPR) repeat protein